MHKKAPPIGGAFAYYFMFNYNLKHWLTICSETGKVLIAILIIICYTVYNVLYVPLRQGRRRGEPLEAQFVPEAGVLKNYIFT